MLETSVLEFLDLSNTSLISTPPHRGLYCDLLGEKLNWAGIRSLNLSDNSLGYAHAAQWEAILGIIARANPSTLFLRSNSSSIFDDLKWKELCDMLKTSPVTALDLSDNRLYYTIKEQRWLMICNQLKGASLRSLDLSSNQFYRSKMDWKVFGEGLKILGIIDVDLRDANFRLLKFKGELNAYPLLTTIY